MHTQNKLIRAKKKIKAKTVRNHKKKNGALRYGYTHQIITDGFSTILENKILTEYLLGSQSYTGC